MKKNAFIAIIVLAALAASCQMKKNTDGLITAADNSAQSVEKAAYEVTYFIDSYDIEEPQIRKLNVFAERINGGEFFAKFRIEDRRGVVYAYDGKTFKKIDMAAGKVRLSDKVNDMFPKHLVGLIMDVEPRFAKQVKTADTILYEGDGEVYGEPCDLVRVVMDIEITGVHLEDLYFFGKEDKALRKHERWAYVGDGKMNQTLIIKNLRTGDSLNFDDALFSPENPPGFSIKNDEPKVKEPELMPKGSAAPEFTLKNIAGKEVSLSSLKGKIVALDFWASWCGPCKLAMPHLQKLHEKYFDKGFVAVGVNCFEENSETAVKYIRDNNYTYECLLEGDEVAQKYLAKFIPTIYLLDREGKIIFSMLGFDEDLEKTLSKLIESEIAKQPA